MSVALPSQLQQAGRKALLAALAASALCLVGIFFNRPQFFQSWLVAWVFFAGLSFGALVIVMMQALTGGAWGLAIRRLCEAAMMTLPLVGLLFLPVILGAHDLFSWSRPGAFSTHAQWQHKHAYLNLPFFSARACFYFVTLSALAFLLRRLSVAQDKGADRTLCSKWISRLSGGGLVFYVLCMNFASTDWVMSLEPDWYSTIFVVILMSGQFLSALALMTALLALLAGREPFAAMITAKHFHDLGNLLLAFVIFWIYVSFSQFLIIWSGNLPKEISWYLHRSTGGWKWVALFLMFFQFLAPLSLLLLRAAKRKRERLGAIAAMILLANVVNVYWLVAPAFHPRGVHIHWLDFAALIAVGGFWTAMFLFFLARQPLLPLLPQETWRHG
jgi:hypothetical protein